MKDKFLFSFNELTAINTKQIIGFSFKYNSGDSEYPHEMYAKTTSGDEVYLNAYKTKQACKNALKELCNRILHSVDTDIIHVPD